MAKLEITSGHTEESKGIVLDKVFAKYGFEVVDLIPLQLMGVKIDIIFCAKKAESLYQEDLKNNSCLVNIDELDKTLSKLRKFVDVAKEEYEKKRK